MQSTVVQYCPNTARCTRYKLRTVSQALHFCLPASLRRLAMRAIVVLTRDARLTTRAKSLRVDGVASATSKWHGSGKGYGVCKCCRDQCGGRRGEGGRSRLGIWKFRRRLDRNGGREPKTQERHGDWGCSSNLSLGNRTAALRSFWNGLGGRLRKSETPNAYAWVFGFLRQQCSRMRPQCS